MKLSEAADDGGKGESVSLGGVVGKKQNVWFTLENIETVFSLLPLNLFLSLI